MVVSRSWHWLALAAGLRRLGTDLSTLKGILNHVEGGVTKIYDRYDRINEKRAALDSWSRRLQEIVTGKPMASNVVEIGA